MNESDCIEMRRLSPGTTGLRDSKRGPAGPVFTLSAHALEALIVQIKDGRLDLPDPAR